MVVGSSFWNKKNVLITGHTGFKGSWLTLMLNKLGAEITGLALEPLSENNLYHQLELSNKINSIYGDINDSDLVKKTIDLCNPDIIFHLAAQPLVRQSYKDPLQTLNTNIIGTANVLDAAKELANLKAFINITSDKCYENKEKVHAFSENDPMGGKDPYSASKGCAELVASSYYQSYFKPNNIPLASVRAGNVIGGGDWSEDRLVPDILNALNKNSDLIIRNPNAIRPWQHVIEPLSGYLLLAEKLYIDGDKWSGGWNFGPEDNDAKSVDWIIDCFKKHSKKNMNVIYEEELSMPESGYLRLNINKSKTFLNWHPKWNIDMAIKLIVDWNNSYINGFSAEKSCLNQIDMYYNIR
jgi:CDP-glucose 4,6-dehydratase